MPVSHIARRAAAKTGVPTPSRPCASPSFVQRDLTEPSPLDGRDGALGIENLEVQDRIHEVQEVGGHSKARNARCRRQLRQRRLARRILHTFPIEVRFTRPIVICRT